MLQTWNHRLRLKLVEQRGRQNIFRSIYLHGFSVKAQPNLAVETVTKIGKGNWEKQLFWGRLRQLLSDEVRYSGCAFIRLSVLC